MKHGHAITGLTCIGLCCAALLSPRLIAADEQEIPPAPTHYMGREIARTMHWTGGRWLLRETRENEEHTSQVIKQLKLKPGMVICDLGCGSGYYTLLLASEVEGKNEAGQRGKVIAVEIQEEYFEDLSERLDEAGVDNVELHVGTVVDPKLEAGSCDMILVVDVYHEFSHPEQMLEKMRAALKPDGLLAVLEFRAEDRNVPIKPLHKMSKKQIMKELTANGFKLVREYDGLPWQHMMFFARDDSELEAIDPNDNWREVMEKEMKKREKNEDRKDVRDAE